MYQKIQTVFSGVTLVGVWWNLLYQILVKK